MNSLSLYLDLDQRVKQEQYQDLFREAGHYRLVKAVAQPGPNHLQKIAAALHKAMDGLAQHLPSLRPANRADLSRKAETITAVTVQGSNPCAY